MTKNINEIEVKGLFGYYNYKVSRNKEVEDPLLIIYGDNGCGKTTILELIFNLLSTAPRSGHKSNIAKIKFKKFVIKFEDQVKIIAKRDKAKLGSYTFMIKENNEIIHKIKLKADSENKIIIREDEDNELLDQMLNYIEKMNLSIHYLTDKRELYSESEHSRDKYRRNHHVPPYEYYESENKEDELEESIRSLESWLKRNVLRNSTVGQRNIQSIYLDLIKRVSTQQEMDISKDHLMKLITKFVSVREETKKFSKYGLLPRLNTEEIEQFLSGLHEKNFRLIYNILEPYVDGLRTKLDSLYDTQKTIEFLISTVNDYFPNKQLKYAVQKGFSIYSRDTQEQIEFSMLSSGERQLLLLFTNIIISSSKASIFIIDEPEISLNVKWQRKLIKTLLEFSKKSKVQYLISTHSIELLTKYKTAVVKLEHIN